MDISLDDFIKKSKVEKRQKQAKQARPQQQQQQHRPQSGVASGRVGDVRQKINLRRNAQLRGLDARQRIMEMKRRSITDARQVLKTKAAPKPAPAKPVEFVMPKKVIKNNLYRMPPPPKVTVEYEAPPSRPTNRIPVQVTLRSQARPVAVSRQYERQPPAPRSREPPAPVYRQRSRSPPVYSQRSRTPPRRSEAKIVQGFKVTISNLHPGVTREDIYELFSSVGSVKKCVLHRPGEAEVVYLKKEDATEAVKRYHRRELDGMPMKLSVSSVGIKVSDGGGGSGGGGGVPVDEQAMRAALFRSDSGRHGRPVNFRVAV